MTRLLVLCLALLPALARAHRTSDSYLRLAIEGMRLRGDWAIALGDLELALGLDADADGRITWGELDARRNEVAAYALAHLELVADGASCPVRARETRIDRRSDGTYALLALEADCPAAVATLSIDYGLLFALDAQHRGLVSVRSGDQSRTAVLAPGRRRAELALATPQRGSALVEYGREGVHHIWIGADHVLFLLSLLLPAVLRRQHGRWEPAASLAPALGEVLRVVTAFTAAHSITLSLAVLGVLAVPSRWVESAIAASVVLAALNNLWPLVDARRWAGAFGFGLVHGMGFASVLAELGLPAAGRAVALFGFNLGVELGQVAIVAVFVPLAFAARRSAAYRRLGLGVGSLAIALVAAVWFVERGLGVRLEPWS